jgi:hypothetical protein
MGIGGWVTQNWFDLFSAVGIIGSLWFTAISLRSDAKTRRVANLLTMTQSHRELWMEFYHNPELRRVLDPAADVSSQPVTPGEREFVNLVLQHLSSVYQAMQSDLTVKPEGLRRDVHEFFELPIPKAVWEKMKPFQDRDFVAFVESCLRLQ